MAVNHRGQPGSHGQGRPSNNIYTDQGQSMWALGNHSFTQQTLVSAYSVPGTVLDGYDMVISKTKSCPHGLHSGEG